MLRSLALRLAWGSLALLCLCAAFADFLAPYRNFYTNRNFNFAPPTPVRFWDDQGRLVRPFIYRQQRSYDAAGRPVYTVDRSVRYELQFLVRSRDPRARYTPFPINLIPAFARDLLGINLTTDLKLFGIDAPLDEVPFYLLGSDIVGNDILSSILYGSRWNLAIGAAGSLLAAALGLALALAGRLLGGAADRLVQLAVMLVGLMPHGFLLLALLVLFYGLNLPLWLALGGVLLDAALIDLDIITVSLRQRLGQAPRAAVITPPLRLSDHLLEHSLGYLAVTWGLVLALQSSFADASYLERWWVLLPVPVLLAVFIAWTLLGDTAGRALLRRASIAP